MKRTPEAIADELAKLRDLAKRLPVARRNLEIVIDALENHVSEDDVYEQHDSESNAFQYALDAAQWLSGDSDDLPSEGWE